MTVTAPATFTIEETAQLLGIGRSAAYAAAHRDELPVPVIRVGRRLLVSRHRLMALLGMPVNELSPAEEPGSTKSTDPGGHVEGYPHT
jgi:excisionase family DNA binding protein